MAIRLYKKKIEYGVSRYFSPQPQGIYVINTDYLEESFENKICIFVSRLNANNMIIDRIAYNEKKQKMYFLYAKWGEIETRVITFPIEVEVFSWVQQFEVNLTRNGKVIKQLWFWERMKHVTHTQKIKL